MKTVLVTGGAGFIGSNFIRHVLGKYEDYRVLNLDKLTYAGNLENLEDIEDDPRYEFHLGDICDHKVVDSLVERCDLVVNFAAESHVDRSIASPGDFVLTDVYGPYTLLEAVRKYDIQRYLQVSTDEVYGSVEEGASVEDDGLAPRSPYAATKAGGELLVRAYYETYVVPAVITRGSNNIGPYQYPEKATPLFITNAIDDKPLPIYGDGKALRDYVYVKDHCEAIDLVMQVGKVGGAYNIGGGNQVNTVELAQKILDILEKPKDLIKFVEDRPGHDRRYCLDSSGMLKLGWNPEYTFDEALRITVEWYVENQNWWRRIKEKENYRIYYEDHYKERLEG